MAKSSTPKIEKGAVIAIPLGDGRWVISQVYHPGTSFFLLVFDQITDVLRDPVTMAGRPILGSWTNDAEIYRGNWKLLTHLPVAPAIFQEPEYVVTVCGEQMAETFDGAKRHPIAPHDAQFRDTKKSRSPLLVQDAVRAFFGVEEWIAYYDAMLLNPRFYTK